MIPFYGQTDKPQVTSPYKTPAVNGYTSNLMYPQSSIYQEQTNEQPFYGPLIQVNLDETALTRERLLEQPLDFYITKVAHKNVEGPGYEANNISFTHQIKFK